MYDLRGQAINSIGVRPGRGLCWLGLCLAVAALGWGCGGARVSGLKGAQDYYEEGMRALEKGRCIKAVEQFQFAVNNFPGAQVAPDAQYHLGEAYFCNEEFLEASFEFQRLLDTYPRSGWADEAQFMIGETNFKQLRRPELDQKETVGALNAYRRFIEDYPDSPLVLRAQGRISDCRARLAEKSYLSARLYHRQKHLDAALMGYKEIVRNYPDTPWYWEALLQMGDIAQKQDKPLEARTYWEEVWQQAPGDELKKRAEEKIDGLSLPAGD
ncbi:MAG: outer membrane protein assembly factor BamD [Candidatus Latescibacteria bacterium]|nr:outer membrane protein assembly factor BamD [Candidatus Latescibacterota bacterium]